MSTNRHDRITAEIVRNYLETVCKELSATVENTALSPIFTLNHDYSCGVFYWDTRDVHLLARDQAVPVHIFASLESVRMIFTHFGGDIHEDDVFLVTDPYLGGTHCPDWTVMKPVFVSGRPAFVPCVRGHINDVGGPVPGNYNVNAREVWQEGFRIPPVRIAEKGRPVRDLTEVILANTRLPIEIRGDLLAMIGACTVGERRIEELLAKYGPDVLEASVEYVLNHSESQLRAEISRWRDGTYSHTELLDHDFAGNHDLPIHVAVTIDRDQLTIDFEGSSGQADGFVNSPRGNTLSQVFTSITALCPEIPVNSGFFRPITVLLPDRSIVNAESPAPVGHCTLVPGTTIIDSLMKAFEQVVPHLVGTAACDLNSARCFGVNSRTGKFWVGSDIGASPMSAGGAYGSDGWGAWAATFCALRLPPLEMYEVQYPYFYELDEYVTDSAAPGQWRGAPAVAFRRKNLDEMRCTIYNSSYRHPLVGYVGGKRGAGNFWVIREGRPDESVVTESCFAEVLPAGSYLFAQSGAGGGWGNPLDRNPDMVLTDWLDELISTAAAYRDYGVVIDVESQRVDSIQTEKRRQALRQESEPKV